MNKYLLLLSLPILILSCEKKMNETPKPFPKEKTIDWMQDLIKKFPTKTITLKKISIPRAHDAGMYEVNNCFAGNSCNTQTQDKNITEMLESGIRVFDVRPTFLDGEFWTFHKTECGGFGCDGVKLETFLKQTKSYLEKHNELVIFEISHFCEIIPTNIDFSNMLNSILGNLIYTENQAQNTNLIDKPLSEILSESDLSGKIILLMEGLGSDENKSLGYFDLSFISKEGQYANKDKFEEMESDQQNKFNNYDETNNSIFSLSWTVTQTNALAVGCFNEDPTSIADITKKVSNELANTLNQWKNLGIITKSKIPNYISVDFANTMVTEQCILLSEYSLE